MARAKDLAGLAALAGLGYALTSQYRNKVDLTEKDSNPDRKARPDSTENRLESQGDTIKRSMQTAPLDDSRTDAASSGDEMSKYAADYRPPAPKSAQVEDVDPYANYEGGDLLTGTKLRTQPASNVADAVRNENAARSVAKAAQADANRAANARDNKAATKKYSVATDQYRNLSHAAAVTNARKKEAKLSRRSPGDEMSDYAAAKTAATTAPTTTSKVKDTAKEVVKTIAKTATNPLSSTSPATDYYRGTDGKMHKKTPEPAPKTESEWGTQNIKRNLLNAPSDIMKNVKNFGSALSDFETPAERNSRLSKEASGMKRGGAVKMASGGSVSASRRGDGIAQRGKTRGKMC